MIPGNNETAIKSFSCPLQREKNQTMNDQDFFPGTKMARSVVTNVIPTTQERSACRNEAQPQTRT
ncbi:hypothetical protein D6783_00665 [Candidatus Woesearchaeota archaeon]|nr:MAG: hypothetical protein D6783_00665 [Candidatus Woesearchaeota archaeon]